jgi:GPH family glycoside/pentoside/hexuronide:cation symporter
MLICYGLGSAAPTLAQEFCGAFLLLFYTELAGLDPVWVGTALLFRMVLDALIDPLVGRWSDRTTNVAGRRRPWVFSGSLPGLMFLVILFAVPDGRQWFHIVYLAIASTLMAIFFSFASIPHMAMAFEMSDEPKERVRIVGYRNFVESLCSLMALLSGPLALGFVGSTYFGRTLSRADCYGLAAGVILVLGSVTAAIFYRGTREAPCPVQEVQVNLFQSFAETFRNRLFRTLVLVYCLLVIANRTALAQLFLLLEHFHGKSGDATIPLLLSFYAGSLLSMPVWVIVGPLFGRIQSLLAAIIVWPLMYSALAAIHWTDAGLLAISFGMGASFSGILAMLGALVPDAVDADRIQNGQRREGLHASVISLTLQAGLGVGYLLTGLALQFAGYRGSTSPTPEVVVGLRISTAGFPLILSIAAALMLFCSPFMVRARKSRYSDRDEGEGT